MASSDSPPGGDRDVFSGLPNARPQRRSAKRDRARGAAKPAGAAESAQTGEGKAASRAAGKSATKAKAKPSRGPAAGGKPRAKAAAAPTSSPVPPAGYATPTDDDRPHGTDLVGTAVQAVGELAQIGVAAGGRALRSAIQRLPRP
jgi:hypothetical protein